MTLKYRNGPLRPANLTDFAPELRYMVGGGPNGVQPMTPQDLAAVVLGVAPAHLPPIVLGFLDRARECMAYGGYHYPFLTIGLGQLGLAAEAGLREYATQVGIDPLNKNGNPLGMHHLLDRLLGAGKITPRQYEYWQSVKEWRNYISHPTEIVRLPIGVILGQLNTLTLALLELFPLPEGQEWP